MNIRLFLLWRVDSPWKLPLYVTCCSWVLIIYFKLFIMATYGNLLYHKFISIANQSMAKLNFDDVYLWTINKRAYPTTNGMSHWQNTAILKRDDQPILAFSQMEISCSHDIKNGLSSFNKKGIFYFFLFLWSSGYL